MPIHFDYSTMDVDLNELDELEEYISEGDVDTDRVFEEEEGEQADVKRNFEKVIVVDKIPAGVPKEKFEKLQGVLLKVFKVGGEGCIDDDGVCIPTDSNGCTLGWAFVAYKSADIARKAVSGLDGFKLDKNHTFHVFPYADLQKFSTWPEEYKTPEEPEFTAGPNLRSWLLDPAFRDQLLLRHGSNTEIYWSEGIQLNAQTSLVYDGAREKENGKIWCEMYTAWSPLGSYLATFHRQGIAVWGGDKFEKINRFAHMDVQHILFSPNENFLFTWNGKDDNKDPRALVLWDTKSGKELRGFKVARNGNEPTEWPVMRFSADDAFFARQTENGISVFDTKTFRLLEKKPVKAKGIQAFEWSKSDPVLAYWAPEVENMPARVVLMDPATRTEVRSKNLFNVREVKLHWQNAGDFLCAQVLRHSKTGKTTFTNFEIFRMRDHNIPNEMLEVKDMIEAFAWEPDRERFAIIHGENQHRLHVSFYTMGAIRGGSKVEKLFTIENKQVSQIHWSPAGSAVVLAGKSINGNLEFWDVDEKICTAEEEHFMCNEIRWDPSGRMVATVVTQPMFGSVAMRYQLENGFHIWSFQGQSLRKEQMEHFYQFLWRPRPRSILTAKETQKVSRNLKAHMDRFGKEDELRRKRLEAAANKERIEALSQFRDLVSDRQQKAKRVQEERIRMGLAQVEDEEEFEVLDEIEEVFVSEKVEPLFA